MSSLFDNLEPPCANENIVEQFRARTEERFAPISGLSVLDIEYMVYDYIEQILSDNEIDARLLTVVLGGSRCRGLEHPGSDIDIIAEICSTHKEDFLFNILNEEPFEIEGITVDINPITAQETGSLASYLLQVEEYLSAKQ